MEVKHQIQEHAGGVFRELATFAAIDEHRANSLVHFASAMRRLVATDAPRTFNRAAIIAIVDRYDCDFTLRRRQAILVELVVTFNALTDDQYLDIDFTIHVAFATTLFEYIRTWIDLFREIELGYESTRILENVTCALGDVLAIGSIGYGIEHRTSIKSGFLNSVLEALQRPASLARTVRDAAFGLRALLTPSLFFSVSKVLLYIVTSSAFTLEFWDNLGITYDRSSIYMQTTVGGELPTERSQIQALFMGSARVEWYAFFPTVAIERPQILKFYSQFKNSLVVLFGYASHILMEHVPRAFYSSSLDSFLRLEVWFIAAVAVGVLTVRKLATVGQGARQIQQMQTLARTQDEISEAVTFVQAVRTKLEEDKKKLEEEKKAEQERLESASPPPAESIEELIDRTFMMPVRFT